MDDQQRLFQLIRDQIARKSESITPENVLEVTKDIKQLLKSLKILSPITFLPAKTSETAAPAVEKKESAAPAAPEKKETTAPTAAAPTTITKPVATTPTSQPTLKPEQAPTPVVPALREHWNPQHNEYTGRFRRALAGGYVGEIYMPEVVLRALHSRPNNGDWVRAVLQPSSTGRTNEVPRYIFYIVKRATTPTDVRLQEFVPVIYRSDVRRFFIEFKAPGAELTQSVLISEYDATKFHLKTGDYIDFSYHDGKIAEGRVIWKYSPAAVQVIRKERQFAKPTEREEKPAEHEEKPAAAQPAAAATAKPAAPAAETEPKPTTAQPAAAEETKTPAAEEHTGATPTIEKPAKPASKKSVHKSSGRKAQPIFEGATFLFVAMDNAGPSKTFRKTIESRGGKMVLSSMKDGTATLRRKVTRADFVVVYLPSVHHWQMWEAKDQAKKIEKPIYFARTTNPRNLIQAFHRNDISREATVSEA
ncbi:DUF2325 domain-containing protein [Schleiferilactobacillus shenzhenensis]|nr:DUF2325 domain-containing protein [Schleiferilactobacillus shenzhenensis]